jgi:hypothetical protein
MAASQRGTKTLPNGSSSITIVRGTDAGFDTTVIVARTRLRVTARTAGTDLNTYTNYSVGWYFTDGDTITVLRSGTTSDVIIEWELTEFDSGQLVAQPVVMAFAATTTATAAISTASIGGERWIESNGLVGAQETAARSTANVRFNSTTEVGATRGTATGTVTLYATVYEHVDATVQTVEQTLTTNTETNHDETITSVDTAKTFVVGSLRCAGATDLNAGSWQARLTSATNLRWSRNSATSWTGTITCYVVSFADDTTVAPYTITHSDGTGTVDTTITAVTLASASVMLSGMMVPYIGLTASAGAFGRTMATAALTSTTNVQTIKAIATTALTQYTQVIQWGAAGPATGFVLDPESGTTNGSGVLTTTATSDDAMTASGEVRLITATVNGTVSARLTHRPS